MLRKKLKSACEQRVTSVPSNRYQQTGKQAERFAHH
jgi:hypothetical protein